MKDSDAFKKKLWNFGGQIKLYHCSNKRKQVEWSYYWREAQSVTVIQTWETLFLVGKTGKLVNVSQGESGGKGDKGPGGRRDRVAVWEWD